MKLVLTCEHGGNHIPEMFKLYFKNNLDILETHKGYDLGSFDVFNTLKPLSTYSMFSKTSRLLIELNRSLHHKSLFSEYSKSLSKTEKENLVDTYYLPYRNEVETIIKNLIESKENVLHISIHSFTPILNTTERYCDIGLLYDSSNSKERLFCKQLKTGINILKPNLNVRYNYPYLGKADGFTTYLRKQFPENYLGIELEINQKFSKNNIVNLTIKETLFQVIGQLID
ncbi:N-formylglutamate amidohydrolase [Yeosuana marina]|uniref:N-formylglutamate amidohydrolase n=1 Tax=Yeosuana marina TaxID=1565536 RepID=UPI0030EBA917|tara:strand:+ start:5037 stop:5720 length:684 start_codon:yes stop_codon:yes gene_type:complete